MSQSCFIFALVCKLLYSGDIIQYPDSACWARQVTTSPFTIITYLSGTLVYCHLVIDKEIFLKK